MLTYVGLGLAGGALAFAHCLGMCGGFALHLSRAPSRWGVLARQLLWHAGKTFSYVFLGAMAGFVGGLAGAASAMPWVQKALAYAAGAAMVLMGLAILGLLPFRRGRWGEGRGKDVERESVEGGASEEEKAKEPSTSRSTLHPPPSTAVPSGLAPPASGLSPSGEGLLASLFRQFFREPTPAGAFVLGLATGFLPCPIVIGFLSLSVTSGSVLTGIATMAAMGVGTVWSLLLLGLSGHVLTLRVRRRGAAVAGAVLIVLGAATALRGTETFHHLLGCPRVPSQAVPAESQERAPGKSCCGPASPR